MKARIRKWGNSLALRIPRTFAEEAQLTEDSPVEIVLTDGKLVITPLAEPVPTLEELLSLITEENRHPEVDWGSPVGKEVW